MPTQPETAAPETELIPGGMLPLNATSNTLVNNAAGAAGALAGWAISSIGKKVREVWPPLLNDIVDRPLAQLAAGDLQTTMASAAGAAIDRPTSAPVPMGVNGGLSGSLLAAAVPPPLTPTFSSPSGVPTRSLTTASAATSRSKGMQLGATKVPSNISSIPDWAEEAAAEVETQGASPWGNDDLMDVNADEDDWSKTFR